MSKHLQPALYSGRPLEQQWINCVYGIHDLFCGCLQPIQHLIDITNQEKCRHTKDIGTTTEEETHGEEHFDFDAGDLEKLFAENTEEDTNG